MDSSTFCHLVDSTSFSHLVHSTLGKVPRFVIYWIVPRFVIYWIIPRFFLFSGKSSSVHLVDILVLHACTHCTVPHKGMGDTKETNMAKH